MTDDNAYVDTDEKMLDPDGDAANASPMCGASPEQVNQRLQQLARDFETQIMAIKDPLERRIAVGAMAVAGGNLGMAMRLDPRAFAGFFDGSTMNAGIALLASMAAGGLVAKVNADGVKVVPQDADALAIILAKIAEATATVEARRAVEPESSDSGSNTSAN